MISNALHLELRSEAQKLFRDAIRRKQIIRPDICDFCNIKTHYISGHHHDYSKPYDIDWLCKSCHARIHTKRKNL